MQSLIVIILLRGNRNHIQFTLGMRSTQHWQPWPLPHIVDDSANVRLKEYQLMLYYIADYMVIGYTYGIVDCVHNALITHPYHSDMSLTRAHRIRFCDHLFDFALGGVHPQVPQGCRQFASVNITIPVLIKHAKTLPVV